MSSKQSRQAEVDVSRNFIDYCAQAMRSRITWPVLTLTISAICVLVFWFQQVNELGLQNKLKYFCQQEVHLYSKHFIQPRLEDLYTDCRLMLEKIHHSDDKPRAIVEIAKIRANSVYHYKNMINSLSILNVRFSALAPELKLTSYLMYRSDSWNAWHMLTAVFAHGGYTHLSLNLLFFLIFATFVEWMIGRKYYLLSFFILVFGTQIAYSTVFYLINTAAPTIGLSGVVIGMIGIAVVLLYAFKPKYMPDGLLIALWLLVITFLVINLYGLIPKQFESGVNFIAHSAGAILGLIIGLIMYPGVRRAMLAEQHAGTDKD